MCYVGHLGIIQIQTLSMPILLENIMALDELKFCVGLFEIGSWLVGGIEADYLTRDLGL